MEFKVIILMISIFSFVGTLVFEKKILDSFINTLEKF